MLRYMCMGGRAGILRLADHPRLARQAPPDPDPLSPPGQGGAVLRAVLGHAPIVPHGAARRGMAATAAAGCGGAVLGVQRGEPGAEAGLELPGAARRGRLGAGRRGGGRHTGGWTQSLFLSDQNKASGTRHGKSGFPFSSMVQHWVYHPSL